MTTISSPAEPAANSTKVTSTSFPLVWVAILAGMAVLLRFFFMMYTHRTWEDALIVDVMSENAASGLGFTTLGGPRVHAFTSPLTVLVPLVADLVHVGFGLTFIKIVSALVSAVAVTFGALTARDLGLSRPLIVLVAGFLAFEHHQILWGMSGMETEMVVAILFFSMWSLLNFSPRRMGIAMGLCMYARPDFAIWICIMSAFLFYDARKKRAWKTLAIMAGTGALIYVPWLIFATAYYGSPIPNSLMAKNAGYFRWTSGFTGSAWAFMAKAKSVFMNALAPLGPSYGGNGTGFMRFHGSYRVEQLMVALLIVGLIVALSRRDFRVLPIFSFFGFYAAYYTFLVPTVSGWYCVPFTAVAVICAAYGLNSLINLVPRRWHSGIGVVAAAAYLSTIVLILPTTFRGERNVQLYVEDEGRKQIGLYLHQISQPGDTIGCEPLGYISYYSRRTVFDYPGLGNPRVVAFLRANQDKKSLDYVLEHFRPTYLVLRQYEYLYYTAMPRNAWIDRDYMPIREFKVPPENVAKLLFPSKNVDLDFIVYRKK